MMCPSSLHFVWLPFLLYSFPQLSFLPSHLYRQVKKWIGSSLLRIIQDFSAVLYIYVRQIKVELVCVAMIHKLINNDKLKQV